MALRYVLTPAAVSWAPLSRVQRRAGSQAAQGWLKLDDTADAAQEARRSEDKRATSVLREVLKGDLASDRERDRKARPTFPIPHRWKSGRKRGMDADDKKPIDTLSAFMEAESSRRPDGTAAYMSPREQKIATRRKSRGLDLLADVAALKGGSFPWALLFAEKGRALMEKARVPFLVRAHFRNANALCADDSVRASSIVEIRNANTQMLQGYGLYGGDTSKASDALVYPFLWTDLQTKIDDVFWATRLRRALAMRKSMVDMTSTTGFRLLNGEADAFPGLVVDIFGKLARVSCARFAVRVLPVLLDFLRSDLLCEHVLIRDTVTGGTQWAFGTAESVVYTESGCRFHWDPKLRPRLHHRASRAVARMLCSDKTRVLHLFSHDGGFAAACAAAGAKQVVAVDSGADYERTVRNLELNFGPSAEGKWEAVRKRPPQYIRSVEPGSFDFIIVDPPPAFAVSVDGEGMRVLSNEVDHRVISFLKDVAMQALMRVSVGGYVMLFCTAMDVSEKLWQLIVRWASAESQRTVQQLRQLTPGIDHPENLTSTFSEGAYRGLLLRVTS